MAVLGHRPGAAERLERVWSEPDNLVTRLTTVDHKKIGIRYLVTAFVFFALAGAEALAMRAQLALPRNDLIGPEAYNQLFTMHGVTMIFLFATPALFGFGNFVVPLMIGARDMAFPLLNAFGYWVFLFAGAFMYSSFLWGLAPNDGWFNYVPLSLREYTPELNIDFYTLGLIFLGIGTTAGASNFIVTIFKLRAPGMSLNRMPLFCWAILVTSFAVIFALPALTAANVLLELERRLGFHFFAVEAGGDPVLWQHLFWIFGHPDVYIIFLPAVGIVSSVIPVFSGRPIVGYTWLVLATIATGIIGFGVWTHHMFALSLPMITMGLFAAASMIITIPSGIQVFAWLATMLRGRPRLEAPMLYAVGFLVVFVMGGVTGVMFAAVPFDQQITDSYFVVAHFHYVLFGGAVFPILAGIYFWLPKMIGRMPDRRLGTWSFWLVFVGFNLTFFPMHVTGLLGMPRRVYTYEGGLGWDLVNLASSAGAMVLAAGLLVVAVDVLLARRRGPRSGPDPWRGDTLEWTTESPPPEYNFAAIPVVESLHPAWRTANREADAERAGPDGMALAEGHQALATTVLEGEPQDVVDMPAASIWPLLVAIGLLVFFVGALIGEPLVMAAGIAGTLAPMAGWHRPQSKLQDQ